VNPTSLGFTPADTAYTTTFTALTAGATLVSVTEPSGFTVPTGNANSITAKRLNGRRPPHPTPSWVRVWKFPAPNHFDRRAGGADGGYAGQQRSRELRFGTSATDPGAGTIPIPGCTPPVPDPDQCMQDH